MITTLAIRRFNALRPADPGALADIAEGEQVRLVITRPNARSLRQHNLFFALLGLAAEHMGWTIEQTLVWSKIAAGHVDYITDRDGLITLIPKSISFSKMDQDEFKAFFDAAGDAVLRRLMPPGTAKADMVEEIFSRTGEKP